MTDTIAAFQGFGECFATQAVAQGSRSRREVQGFINSRIDLEFTGALTDASVDEAIRLGWISMQGGALVLTPLGAAILPLLDPPRHRPAPPPIPAIPRFPVVVWRSPMSDIRIVGWNGSAAGIDDLTTLTTTGDDSWAAVGIQPESEPEGYGIVQLEQVRFAHTLLDLDDKGAIEFDEAAGRYRIRQTGEAVDVLDVSIALLGLRGQRLDFTLSNGQHRTNAVLGAGGLRVRVRYRGASPADLNHLALAEFSGGTAEDPLIRVR